MEAHENFTTFDTEIMLETYKPTSHFLLSFDTAVNNISLILTQEQLHQLRLAIYATEDEAIEMEKTL